MALAPKPDADAQPTVDVDQLRGFTTEDIESFKALGVEVLLHSETYGDVWLVPTYTGRERKEITPEHAATLARVVYRPSPKVRDEREMAPCVEPLANRLAGVSPGRVPFARTVP